MSESENQTEESKKSPLGIILIIFSLLIGVIAIGLYNNARNVESGVDEQSLDTIETVSDETGSKDAVQTEEKIAEDETAEDVKEQQDTVKQASSESSFDLKNASTPRILGDANAAVKISEHSSFTCGACGAFHKGNFKSIKADYIDTGKAYIIFDDFPRNQFDIKVGAIARCVPEEAYFNFLQLLFETQKEWLNDDYITYVSQNAKLTGASEEEVNACLNSTELHEALAEHQKAAADTHGVKATPTLVINDSVVMSGLDPYEKIKNVIEAELSKTSQ